MELPWHHAENRAPIRAARNMYFDEYQYPRIFDVTGVPPSVFFAQRKKSWKKMKDRVDEAYIVRLRAKILSQEAGDIIKKGAEIINLYFTAMLKRGDKIEMKDANMAGQLMRNLHSMQRLEEGKPTDISFIQKMTGEEAAEYLREMAKEQAEKHDMTMFAVGEEVTEEELVQEYKDGNNSGVH